LRRRPARVSTRRTTVIVHVVPIADPFNDVARHVVQSIPIRRIRGHLHGAVRGIVRLARRHRVAIGVLPTTQSTPRSVSPFGFRGQAQYAFASSHVMPTTGWSSLRALDRPPGWPVATTNAFHCLNVSSVLASQNASSATSCTGCSFGEARSERSPIVKAPPGTATNSTPPTVQSMPAAGEDGHPCPWSASG
jgi:hypothetical protein